MNNADLKAMIRTVPDFPKKGIMFRDITTILQNKDGFKYVIDKFYERYKDKDVDVAINSNDLRIDTYRAGGHGGQYLQKTDSAVRITHIPTNTVVACQDERSQLKNKLKALKILKARIYDVIKNQRQQKVADERKKQVGTGDRSEKIRTYNFPQDRITDHRINENFHNISTIMEGDLDGIIEKFKKTEFI